MCDRHWCYGTIAGKEFLRDIKMVFRYGVVMRTVEDMYDIYRWRAWWRDKVPYGESMKVAGYSGISVPVERGNALRALIRSGSFVRKSGVITRINRVVG